MTEIIASYNRCTASLVERKLLFVSGYVIGGLVRHLLEQPKTRIPDR
jgi:hypothetical protein